MKNHRPLGKFFFLFYGSTKVHEVLYGTNMDLVYHDILVDFSEPYMLS